jgi:hypothetical protein
MLKRCSGCKTYLYKNGDVSGYENFARNIGVNVDASEIDEINLSTGKQYFAKKDYKNAISYYEKYLTQNPTGEGFIRRSMNWEKVIIKPIILQKLYLFYRKLLEFRMIIRMMHKPV